MNFRKLIPVFWMTVGGCVATLDESALHELSGEASTTTDSSSSGSSSDAASPLKTTVVADTQMAISSVNVRGFEPGQDLAAITMPAGSGENLTYSMTGLPDWLQFTPDADARRVSLKGRTTVPANAIRDIEVTYTVSSSTKSDSVTLLLNDVDGDTVNDGLEALYDEAPRVNSRGWQWCSRKQTSLCLKWPTKLTYPRQEVFSKDVDNRTTDLDGDGTKDATEAKNGTNPFLFSTQRNFTERKTLTTGDDPRRCVAIDLLGDGFLDLCCTNYSNNIGTTISCFTGTSGGTFGGDSLTNIAVGALGPFGIDAGDCDGDGDQDLFTANDAAGGITVIRKTASGFDFPFGIGIGARPYDVTSVDLNADGLLDLAVSTEAGNRLHLLRGNGSCGFTEYLSVAAGNGASGITYGDFDLDGDIDLAVANDGETSISVFMGDGSGQVGAGVKYTTGAGPTNVMAGDLDGDGYVDLATGNYNGGVGTTVSILYNDGDGTFDGRSVRTLEGGIGTSIRVIADIDGDRDLDIVIKNDGSRTISYFANNGDGTFAYRVDIPTTANATLAGIEVGDFDNDGDLDLAVVNAGEDSIRVLHNN